MKRRGLLLINVGTPESPSPKDVGTYLKEFLMDPEVVDIPYALRWVLVHVLVVPKRRFASSELYKKIWTAEGSPLLLHLNNLCAKLQKALGKGTLVQGSMRYGSPSIESAVRKFAQEKIEDVTVFPLYPQYSLAATKSSQEFAENLFKELAPGTRLKFIGPFYQNEAYLSTAVDISAPELKAFPWDHVLFSFHGLPERQIRKTDATGAHCLEKPDCCRSVTDVNRDCYRAQSYWTARTLAKRLGIPREKYSTCFQSRLGGSPWIRPYTDMFYETLPKQGVKNLAVLCPSFVADCLETLEEVQIRGKEQFQKAGGQDLRLIPSLNSDDRWVQAIQTLLP